MGSSKKIYGKELVKYKRLLFLNKLQQDVLIGTILGDANVRIIKKEAFLTVSHSEKQVDYVNWKYKIFREWVLTEPREEFRTYYKNLEKKLISWRFSTLSHPLLTKYYNLFYPKGKKLIPKSIDIILKSPITLAVWFMDDGSRKPYGKGAFLHTQSFSLRDQKRLIKVLKKNFSIDAKLSSAGLWKDHRLFRLYITAGSFDHFRSLVLPYLLPSFHYKLSLKS